MTQPNPTTLTFTADERAKLIELLNAALGETRIEVHRTHTPGYREQVQQEEAMLRGLLERLRGS